MTFEETYAVDNDKKDSSRRKLANQSSEGFTQSSEVEQLQLLTKANRNEVESHGAEAQYLCYQAAHHAARSSHGIAHGCVVSAEEVDDCGFWSILQALDKITADQ